MSIDDLQQVVSHIELYPGRYRNKIAGVNLRTDEGEPA